MAVCKFHQKTGVLKYEKLDKLIAVGLQNIWTV